jgi:hypothetical protein
VTSRSPRVAAPAGVSSAPGSRQGLRLWMTATSTGAASRRRVPRPTPLPSAGSARERPGGGAAARRQANVHRRPDPSPSSALRWTFADACMPSRPAAGRPPAGATCAHRSRDQEGARIEGVANLDESTRLPSHIPSRASVGSRHWSPSPCRRCPRDDAGRGRSDGGGWGGATTAVAHDRSSGVPRCARSAAEWTQWIAATETVRASRRRVARLTANRRHPSARWVPVARTWRAVGVLGAVQPRDLTSRASRERPRAGLDPPVFPADDGGHRSRGVMRQPPCAARRAPRLKERPRQTPHEAGRSRVVGTPPRA